MSNIIRAIGGNPDQTVSVAPAVDLDDALNQNSLADLFGIGGLADEIADWNLAKVVGKLYFGQATALNRPADSLAFGWYLSANPKYGKQVICLLDEHRTFTRWFSAGVWAATWTEQPRIDQIIGIGQTRQDVSASRAASVLYTNNTGRPIEISVSTGLGTSAADAMANIQTNSTTAVITTGPYYAGV